MILMLFRNHHRSAATSYPRRHCVKVVGLAVAALQYHLTVPFKRSITSSILNSSIFSFCTYIFDSWVASFAPIPLLHTAAMIANERLQSAPLFFNNFAAFKRRLVALPPSYFNAGVDNGAHFLKLYNNYGTGEAHLHRLEHFGSPP